MVLNDAKEHKKQPPQLGTAFRFWDILRAGLNNLRQYIPVTLNQRDNITLAIIEPPCYCLSL
jgi:hypothetical protein